MSYRPGIIKSAGLTNVVPLAGVEPAIPQGAYKSRAATNAFLRGEGSAYIRLLLIQFAGRSGGLSRLRARPFGNAHTIRQPFQVVLFAEVVICGVLLLE